MRNAGNSLFAIFQLATKIADKHDVVTRLHFSAPADVRSHFGAGNCKDRLRSVTDGLGGECGVQVNDLIISVIINRQSLPGDMDQVEIRSVIPLW